MDSRQIEESLEISQQIDGNSEARISTWPVNDDMCEPERKLSATVGIVTRYLEDKLVISQDPGESHSTIPDLEYLGAVELCWLCDLGNRGSDMLLPSYVCGGSIFGKADEIV
jgi:hypothetical protein